jgi:hypothetical protein
MVRVKRKLRAITDSDSQLKKTFSTGIESF